MTGSRYRSIREELTRAARRLNPLARAGGEAHRELWALKDISFEVPPGQALGIIGPNGAGKSTLLKLVAGITFPTRGRIEVRGRVASLIEVGAGIHPELTGRENIYLNGTLLGMSRPEISAKFDHIVEFAELAPFIDMPVKRYSSGMFIRLGFAVAVHLEPDILLVDEVLSVGDIAFQRKSSERMRHLLQGGRTVLLVSHNLPVIQSASERVLLLLNGQVAATGPAEDVVRTYVSMFQTPEAGAGTRPIRESPDADPAVRVLEVTIGGKVYTGDPLPVTWGEALTVQVHYAARHPSALADTYLALAVWRGDALRVVYETTEENPGLLAKGGIRGTISCTLPAYLVPALYSVNVAVHDRVTRALCDGLSNTLFRVTAAERDDGTTAWNPNRSVLALPVAWSADPEPHVPPVPPALFPEGSE
ncbi:MAG TPA: polysaccharide ABC transporter ATP-binding protein [Candidatus Methylomirabilis sp.]|nr:polysaccharide ABC transporter ATP-binding protein [Candidatus Methylomirabilis sp.]